MSIYWLSGAGSTSPRLGWPPVSVSGDFTSLGVPPVSLSACGGSRATWDWMETLARDQPLEAAAKSFSSRRWRWRQGPSVTDALLLSWDRISVCSVFLPLVTGSRSRIAPACTARGVCTHHLGLLFKGHLGVVLTHWH